MKTNAVILNTREIGHCPKCGEIVMMMLKRGQHKTIIFCGGCNEPLKVDDADHAQARSAILEALK